MKELNRHITLNEVTRLLNNEDTRVVTIEQLKSLEAEQKDVQGLISYLSKVDWDYQKVKAFETGAKSEFQQLLNQTKRKNLSWMKVAAVIIPIIGVSTLFYLYQQPAELDDLYAEYYIQEKGLPNLMSSSPDKQFDEAMSAFKDEAYEEAQTEFRALLNQNHENDTLRYYTACSNLELKNYQEAIEDFNKVKGTSVFREKSEFRLALCFLQLNELGHSKKILEKISNSDNHEFKDVAIEMLKEPAFE